jgi:hypothetical protein
MPSKPKRSSRVADMASAPAARRSSRVADMASAPAARRSSRRLQDFGFSLSTELTKKSLDLIAKNEADYAAFPISNDDWVIFFCDYLDFIQSNINKCLANIKGLQHLTINDFYKVDLSGGGFDSDFDDFNKINYNIGLYETLFTQFRDGTNKINNCARLNQLLSYVGAAVLRMAERYNKISANALIEFYRKIATVLEIAVYPEIFLHYMTGDSTGKTLKIDLNYYGQVKHKLYTGIWIRKQEFLGVIAGDGKNFWKKHDSGLRLFVRNYIRRLITYMRTYNASYPLGYELPYNYSANPKNVLKNPLPFDGVYQYSAPPENYYISREDWNYIPNIFLPDNCQTDPRSKEYKNPSDWHHKPPKWWVDRTKEFFDNIEWWHVKDDIIETMSLKLNGSIKHKKWMAINCILPQQYDSYSELWDVEYEDEYSGHGGISKVHTKTNTRNDKKATVIKTFKIISDKDRAVRPIIQGELKSKLREYFKLNVVVVNASKSSKSTQSHLRDDVYVDNLCNYSMLYNSSHKNNDKSNISTDKRKLRANTV